jgi:hypothetical protein
MVDAMPGETRVASDVIARMTSLSTRQVDRLASTGQIPGAKMDRGGWTFSVRLVHRWIKAAEAPFVEHQPFARHAQKLAVAACRLPLLLDEASILSAAQPALGVLTGIYFLIKDGVVIYVGQAMNIAARIGVHAATKDFDSWHWIACKRSELDAMERAYINALLPDLNRDTLTNHVRKMSLLTSEAGR